MLGPLRLRGKDAFTEVCWCVIEEIPGDGDTGEENTGARLVMGGQSSEESQDEGYARLDVGVLLGFEGEDGLVEEDTLVLGSEHFHETFHEVL